MLSHSRFVPSAAAATAAKAIARRGAATLPLWSESLSFASPESDFTTAASSKQQRDYYATTSAPSWSESITFTSPESDFTARSYHSCIEHQAGVESNTSSSNVWSQQLSFASPESDFTFDAAAATEHGHVAASEWSHTLSFASPESDFVSSSLSSSSQQEENDAFDKDFPHDFYALSMAASPETAFGSVAVQELLDDRMKQQLQQVLQESSQQQRHEEEAVAIQDALPKTLAEAMMEQDPRAIVITTAHAPFEIIHVNQAWEGLCGFTKEEALHHTLSMLQGPQTDQHQARHLLQELQRGHAASAVLTNYTKQGRPFQNLVRVAPIREERSQRISHFVGVLEEIMVHHSQHQHWDHHQDDRHMMRAA